MHWVLKLPGPIAPGNNCFGWYLVVGTERNTAGMHAVSEATGELAGHAVIAFVAVVETRSAVEIGHAIAAEPVDAVDIEAAAEIA